MGRFFIRASNERGFKRLVSMRRLEGLVQGVGESDMAAHCDMLRDGGGTALGQNRNSSETRTR